MIKKILFLFIIVLLCNKTHADEQYKIALNNDNNIEETIELSYCNIFLKFESIDDNENARISLELENKHELNTIILFDRAYSEKCLKQQEPSIRYDKIFGGDKGLRIIDYFKEIGYTTRIRPGEKSVISTLEIKANENIKCRLPLYIAKNKDSRNKKLLLMAKDIIELDISVEIKPDSLLLDANERYEQIIKDISKETFCTNKRHKGVKAYELVERYKEKISNLRNDINSIINYRNYMSSDKGYKLFNDILRKLDEIEFEKKFVKYCNNDYRPQKQSNKHNCKYCSLNYDELYKKIENYYIDIYNGKTTKNAVLAEVERIYNCVKHKNRKHNNNYKSRIITYYNKIKSL